ncbi:MAG TPA: DAHL domain-containing protein [Polyangiaceae bacterium]|nr:DAHL domain-containing protein [Polyangiaceae bacterium]
MSLTTLLRMALGLGTLSFVLLFAHAERRGIDYKAEALYSRDLRQLKAADAQLNERLLRSVSGLSAHYDGLVRGTQEMQHLHAVLAKVPEFLGEEAESALRAELGRGAALTRDKASFIESFKMQHAVLRNSLHYLPLAAEKSARTLDHGQTRAVAAAARALMGDALLVEVAPDRDAYAHLAATIHELERARDAISEPEAKSGVDVLLRHARTVAKRKPLVDALVQGILAAPTARSTTRLEELYTAGYRAALDASAMREKALFALAFAIVLMGMTEFILRVQRSNAALARASAELRSANTALASEREKERELGELKTRFVSMTSHEFRTPLSSILSSSELLEKYGERWDAERRIGHLKQIQASARSMNDMLEEILVIGRAEAGALRATPAPLELERFCNRVIDTVNRASNQSHRIRTRFTGEPNVNLDERLLLHVLLNLLENAVKYSPAGSEIQVDVQTAAAETLFAVRDHGIGIPDADIPGLFTSFRRGTNVGQVAGSGLGLAVVHRALTVQGGTIEVKTELGRGSEFLVRLPSNGSRVSELRASA